MPRLLLAAALACAALAAAPPAPAQTLDVSFRFLPDLTSPRISPVVRAFTPGSFNGWGPNSNGRIQPGAPSEMTYVPQRDEYVYTEALDVGSEHFYKLHYHKNGSGSEFEWIVDPLATEPCTFGGFGSDCRLEVTDPMIFQPAREEDGDGQVRFVSASLFGTDAFTEIVYEVNGVEYADGLAHFDAATGLFRAELPAPVPSGAQLRVTATDAAGDVVEASVGRVPPDVPEAPVPAGMRDGINVSADGGEATFVLRAPGKQYVHFIGDPTGWAVDDAFVLAKDDTDPLGTRWWITVDLGDPAEGEAVRFQYLVDGLLRVSDPYAPLVLDQGGDRFIPTVTYPDRPAYPDGETEQLVAAFVPREAAFAWTDGDWERPPMESLVIMEVLVRDLVSRHDFQTVRDTLDYFERLGVTALELMPVSEFDGNESWGYNPNHYFAVDKYYGPPAALKALVDEAHARGMAVILDVVYNHQTGAAPFVRLYNQGTFGAPTAENPWANPSARHPFNVFNDNDHSAPLTELWLDRANAWWIEEYHVDGFRFDLTKGFVQDCNGGPCTDANFSAYNPDRIANLTRMADAMWAVDPEAYVILEHFADAREERELAGHGRAQGFPGMALWSNMNDAYAEAAMGYTNSRSDFRRAYPPNNGYPLDGQITYLESHDEQWQLYKTRRFGACEAAPGGGGACDGAAGYNTRELSTALDRKALTAAFFLTVPGPKMLWQFGELGYGGGPGECLEEDDCPAGTPGRVSNKPIRWDYWADVAPDANGSGLSLTRASAEERADRRDLYRVHAALLDLRNTYPVFRTPDAVSMRAGANQPDRWIKLEHPDLDVVVVGNFGVAPRTVRAPFDAGTWHDVFSRETVDASGATDLTLAAGEWRVYSSAEIDPPTPVAGEPAAGPAAFGIARAFPNPATDRLAVRYTLDAAADVRLEAFDALGRRVAALDAGPRAAGAHEAALDLSGLPSGVYVVRLAAGPQADAVRVTVLR